MRVRSTFMFSLLLAATAAEAQAQGTWRFVEELRIGPSEEGVASFTAIRALEVDRAGRIYVLENQPQDIRVFEADGRFVRHIGRPGAGPGEYQNAAGLAWDSLGRLVVVDEQHARNSFFDTTGRFVESVVRPVSGSYGWNWGGAILRDGRTVELLRLRSADESRNAYAIADARNRLRDTLLVRPIDRASAEATTWRMQRGPRTTYMQVPFTARDVVALDPRGYLWLGHTSRYHIVQVSLRGDTVRTIERKVTPLRVTRREIDSAVASVAERVGAGPDIDPSRIPATKPLFNGFFVDDEGRLWVRVTTAEPGTAFDVFDAGGRYVGVASTPLRLGLNIIVRRGVMYAAAFSDDDVPFVARLGIRR